MELLPGSLVLRPNADVIIAVVGDEAVLFDEHRGLYFGLNEVAATVWQLAQAGKTLGEIRVLVAGEYDVSEDTLVRDVDLLITDLVEKQLCSME